MSQLIALFLFVSFMYFFIVFFFLRTALNHIEACFPHRIKHKKGNCEFLSQNRDIYIYRLAFFKLYMFHEIDRNALALLCLS